VNTQELVLRGPPRRDVAESPDQIRRVDRGQNRLQPLGPFGMFTDELMAQKYVTAAQVRPHRQILPSQ
jgi:hypothetical protein